MGCTGWEFLPFAEPVGPGAAEKVGERVVQVTLRVVHPPPNVGDEDGFGKFQLALVVISKHSLLAPLGHFHTICSCET